MIKKIIIINQQISCDCRFKVNNINKCLLFSQPHIFQEPSKSIFLIDFLI